MGNIKGAAPLSGDLDKYITVATYNNPWEAHLARTKLESEGISALVLDDQTASINWFYSHTTGGVRLQVRQADAEQAIQLLNTDAGEEPAMQKTYSTLKPPAPVCPACGGPHIRPMKFSLRMILLSLLLLGLPLLLSHRRAICLDCGRQWQIT
jgi:hypothetical protein